MSGWSDEPAPERWRTAAAAPPEASRGQASWRGTPERSRAWVPLVILVTGLVLLLYSMQLGSMTTSGYDLQRLQSERNEWRQRNEQLQLELAKVQSLAWIEVEAVRRLGMEKADRVTFLEIAPPAMAAGAGEAAAEQVAELYAPLRAPVVFTAHSLPQRILDWHDPYPDQLRRTCELVAAQAGLRDWRFAYQSASHTGEPWLGPDLLEVLDQIRREGRTGVIVCPVGFVADHLEVLYDIDVEAAAHADALGLHLVRAATLGDGADFVGALADLLGPYAEEEAQA